MAPALPGNPSDSNGSAASAPVKAPITLLKRSRYVFKFTGGDLLHKREVQHVIRFAERVVLLLLRLIPHLDHSDGPYCVLQILDGRVCWLRVRRVRLARSFVRPLPVLRGTVHFPNRSPRVRPSH